jgi:hypothetical protein
MRKLLRRSRIRSNVSGFRSSASLVSSAMPPGSFSLTILTRSATRPAMRGPPHISATPRLDRFPLRPRRASPAAAQPCLCAAFRAIYRPRTAAPPPPPRRAGGLDPRRTAHAISSIPSRQPVRQGAFLPPPRHAGALLPQPREEGRLHQRVVASTKTSAQRA